MAQTIFPSSYTEPTPHPTNLKPEDRDSKFFRNESDVRPQETTILKKQIPNTTLQGS
jgi:hypothetical protein